MALVNTIIARIDQSFILHHNNVFLLYLYLLYSEMITRSTASDRIYIIYCWCLLTSEFAIQ